MSRPPNVGVPHGYYDDQSGNYHQPPPFSPYHDESPARHQSPAPSYGNPFSDAHAQEHPGYAGSTGSGVSATPAEDNFGASAVGGGIAGIAAGVAAAHERESGLQAIRGMPPAAFDRRGPAETPFLGVPSGRGSRASGWASQQSIRSDEVPSDHYPAQPVYSDSPYKRYSSPWDPHVESNEFDPDEIEDDGDDGLGDVPSSQRRTILGVGAAGTGAGYGQVPGGGHFEKKSFLAEEAAKRRKKRILFIILGVIALCAVVAAAVAGGIIGSRRSGGTTDEDDSGLYDQNSPQVQSLLNNPDLKMVFPGMDYTPYNAQYPACLTNPPSQNNVTMDIAVISQLTKTVRMYGTDCNQTDMVVEGIKRLGITDMKVWLGVWLDNNQTTNTRGLTTMYDILDRNGPDPFVGVIIGNEVLFRQDMTPTQLAAVVASVRSNFTEKKISLPIAVADLGDNWSKDGKDFINDVDVVMSNIHPFFAGQPANEGAGWAWDFWQYNDIALTAGTNKQNIISEIGWPSAGGNDCGVDSSGDVKCPNSTAGAVAGIEEMNTFMGDFVCSSLTNKTNYFWFEAFDEPWKVQFNTPGQDWEDKWGLMTPDRVIKSGLNIPDCNGQRIS